MTGLGRTLQAAARRLWWWFFPPEIELPEGLRQLLAYLFPRLDPRAVSFHLGFPHLLSLLRNQAITLPGLWPAGRGRVYVHPRVWDPGSVDGLGLIVHEAFHLLQVQQAGRGRGLGVLHPFIVLYLACAAANRFRYAGHPLETDAYRVAGKRRSLFECHVDPAAVPAEELRRQPVCREPLDLAPLQACCHPAVTDDSGLAFWGKLAASTPGWRPLAGAARWLLGPGGGGRRALASLPALVLLAAGGLLVASWLALWTAAAAVLAGTRLLIEALGGAAAALLWALGGLLLLPGRLARRPARATDRT